MLLQKLKKIANLSLSQMGIGPVHQTLQNNYFKEQLLVTVSDPGIPTFKSHARFGNLKSAKRNNCNV